MKIGICSTDFQPASENELFSRIRSFGFTCSQFSFCSISGQEEILPKYDEELMKRLNQAAKENGIEISAVNCTFNMVDPDEKRLEENIRRMDGMCASAKALGCRILTLCTGSRSTESMWKYHPDNRKPEYWEMMIRSMRQMIAVAERHGVYLAVETEAANIVQTPDHARRLLDEIASPNLKMVLDCANLFPDGTAKKENVDRYIRWAFESYGKEIILAHGKDIAEAEQTTFAPVGQGIVNYDLFLDLLYQHGYQGPMIEHGIYQEDLMKPCISFLSEKIGASRYQLD